MCVSIVTNHLKRSFKKRSKSSVRFATVSVWKNNIQALDLELLLKKTILLFHSTNQAVVVAAALATAGAKTDGEDTWQKNRAKENRTQYFRY
jgi:hypothetical protein